VDGYVIVLKRLTLILEDLKEGPYEMAVVVRFLASMNEINSLRFLYLG